MHLDETATAFFPPSGSQQKIRELEQIKTKLEEEIREQGNKLKCEFEYHYENETPDIREQENILTISIRRL